MSLHVATVHWSRQEAATFTDGKYSRAHDWRFDGGLVVPASSSPHVVPLPYSTAENIDPEEAYVAALASCHMLFFLSLAAKKGFVVDNYVDEAEGTMSRNDKGRMAVTRVVLVPRIVYASLAPSRTEEADLHHQAHDLCFLANSVKTAIEIRLT